MPISRRNFLALASASVVSACSWFPQRIEEARAEVTDASYNVLGNNIEETSQESFEAFQQRLAAYEVSDNQVDPETWMNRWNLLKYQELAKPLLRNLTPLNEQKLRYLIAQEVQSAYSTSQTVWFRKYDASKISNDAVFFWDIPGGKPEIQSFWNEWLYDPRVNGKLYINSPDELLRSLDLPQWQQNVGFVIQDQNGMYTFVYYQAGKLKYVAPCSPGSDSLGTTPTQGLAYGSMKNLSHYFLDDDAKWQSQEVLQSRISQENTIGWSMPYAHQVLKDGVPDGYYTHIWDVDWRRASHGCIRLPALWAYIMFYEGNTDANIYYIPDFNKRLPAENEAS